MSLVVAQIHDGRITLVADTKVTYMHDATRSLRVFQTGEPKLSILRPDLCVGHAGNYGSGALQLLATLRDAPLDAILSALCDASYASFVIASLEGGPTLHHVRGGEVVDRTAIGRAWAGDPDGYEVFRTQEAACPPGLGVEFGLLSSLQYLLTFKVVPTIGGHHTRVGSGSGFFRFVADGGRVLPEVFDVTRVEVTAEGLSIELKTPPGGDTSVMTIDCAAGVEPTLGSLGYFISPAGYGVLFPHDRQWEPVEIRVESFGAFKAAALGLGHHLV